MHFSPKTVRILRRALLTLATLLTALAAVITFENWRGARAWRQYREAAAARGEPLDKFPEPSPLRAERNFMATRFLEEAILTSKEAQPEATKAFLAQTRMLYDFVGGANAWRSGQPPDWPTLRAKWEKGAKVYEKGGVPLPDDLGAVLRQDAVSRVLGELRAAAATRPDSELIRPRWRPGEDFARRPIPRFELARALSVTLMLDAQYSLAERRTDDAFAGAAAGLQLSRGLLAERDATLVGAMIGCVLSKRLLQPVWEGLQNHAWSDAQLAELDRILTDCRALDALERAMHGEQRFAALVDPSEATAAEGEFRALRWLWKISGWRDQNRLAACQVLEPQLAALGARDTADFLPALVRRDRSIEDYLAGHSPYRLLARWVTPAFEKITANATETEALARLARTACALERHRLKHGSLPPALDALCPEFLPAVPRDPIDGRSLRYRLNDDGTFALYSIGMDGRDDRGAAAKASRSNGEAFTGDWIWPQLSSAAAAKP